MPYILELMRAEDIPEVATIERLCFTMPWPTSAYRRELKTPETNRYIVARFIPPEIAARLGMNAPTVESLTRLAHPEWYAPAGNGSRTGTHVEQGGARSFLATLLPWLRKPDNGGYEESRHSPFPIVGYAGLWLMV